MSMLSVCSDKSTKRKSRKSSNCRKSYDLSTLNKYIYSPPIKLNSSIRHISPATSNNKIQGVDSCNDSLERYTKINYRETM